jgi:hypothetical protein
VAQKVITLLEDDLDGGDADESVTFSLDGTTYEIDLNKKNAAALRKALDTYVQAGRKVGGRTRRAGGSKAVADKEQTQAIRAWAVENGYEVSERGRISAAIREAYNAAV